MIGQTLGSYEVLKLLGSGGTGHVYAALDRKTGRQVAIKVLRPEFGDDAALLERFRKEAESLGRLSHRNITEFYALDQGSIGGRHCLFMVMELIDGVTLEQLIQRSGRVDAEAGLAIIAQAIAGLSYAHGLGTIHRDIKPSNLMFTESGLLKVMDFGIARVEGSERLTRQGMIVGTLAYIAPEQIKGDAGDVRSDVYSLGCVLYELLAGVQPFRGDNEYELIRAQIESDPLPLRDFAPDLPPAVEQAVLRALAKDPAARCQSLDEFADRLGIAALEGDMAAIVRDRVLSVDQPAEATADDGDSTIHHPPPARPQPPVAAATPPARRPRIPAMAPFVLAAGLAAIVSAGYLIEQSHLASAELTPQIAPKALPAPPDPTPPASTADAGRPAADPPQVAAVSPPPPPPEPDPPAAAPPIPLAPAPAEPAVPGSLAGEITTYAGDGWPMIEGHVVRLAGVDMLPPEAAKPAADWIRAHGNFLDCRLGAGNTYRCLTRQNLDLAQAILLNGGAHASTDAPAAYRDAEAEARKAKRGIWR